MINRSVERLLLRRLFLIAIFILPFVVPVSVKAQEAPQVSVGPKDKKQITAEKDKAKKKKAALKGQEKLRKQHLKLQTKEVRKRMKKNQRKVKKGHGKRRKRNDQRIRDVSR